MKGIQIIAAGRAVPEKIMDNQEMSALADTSDEWIRTRTGIGQRHICTEETCVTLAVDAARKAIRNAQDASGFCTEDIGAVVVATSTPDYLFPPAACLVQEALGLSEEVIAFDLSAACSGFLYGMDVCRGLLQTGSKPYALLIGSEQLSRIVDYTDRSSCILFGDGAGAVLLKSSENLYIQQNWSRGNKDALYCEGAGRGDAHIHMDGKAVFRFAVKALEQSVQAVLGKSGLSMEDIAFIICHQANERIIGHVSRKYPGHAHKFYKNIEYYGNTSAASIPIILDEMLEAGTLKPGMKVICAAFGAGFTWSSSLFEV